MMQSQLLQESSNWANYFDNITWSSSSLDESCLLHDMDMDMDMDMDIYMGDYEFSPSITTTEDSCDELFPFPLFVQDDFPLQEHSPNLEDLGPFSNESILNIDEIENIFELMEANEIGLPSNYNSFEEGSLRSSMICTETSPNSMPLVQSSLVLPSEGMEFDNQLSIPHLLEAYGEAMEKEQTELANVILRCVKEKVGPVGGIVERLAYYLLQALDNQGQDYLLKESSKNYEAAFRAFYQIFPYGRLAHFASNLAILEAMPQDVDTIHIVDFDIGDGVQWPPLLEAVGRNRAVRLIAIKWKEDSSTCVPSSPWKFEETMRRLQDHSRSFGVKLTVEEMEMEEMINEIMKINKKTNSTSREWLVFNCMVDLPHMGRGRSRMQVKEFLRVAKELLINNSSCTTKKNRGIIALGDGEIVGNFSGFGAFFYGYLKHFDALLESMDWHFPSHLTEARIAMECLFVAPFVNYLACFSKWEEANMEANFVVGLESLRFSKDNVVQAKEMVREGENPYRVSVEGEKENVMALEWNGTPLLKVSTWK